MTAKSERFFCGSFHEPPSEVEEMFKALSVMAGALIAIEIEARSMRLGGVIQKLAAGGLDGWHAYLVQQDGRRREQNDERREQNDERREEE